MLDKLILQETKHCQDEQNGIIEFLLKHYVQEC